MTNATWKLFIYLWNDNLSRTCPKILRFDYKITASFHPIEKKKNYVFLYP